MLQKMFMHDLRKCAICIQTCLESSKTPWTPLGAHDDPPSQLGRGLSPQRLWCLELGPPHFQTKVTPLHIAPVYDAAGAEIPLNSYWSEVDACCIQSVYCRHCADKDRTTTWLGVQVKAVLANCCPRLQLNQASLLSNQFIMQLHTKLHSDSTSVSWVVGCSKCYCRFVSD